MTREDYYKLCDLIWEHNRHYFIENAPLISDQQFDHLVAQLVAVEKRHPEWVSAASPTQRVGEMMTGSFPVVEHEVPMLSLANTYSSEEIQEFLERMQRLLHKDSLEYVCELKMDGIAISVRYEEGILTRAVTRGDGAKGELVTANVRTIQSLPLKLCPPYPRVLEVRGEVYIPKKNFEAINLQNQKEGRPLFANPRNAAAGSLKLLDPQIVAKRKLALTCYGIAEVDSIPSDQTQSQVLKSLQSIGLPIIGEYRLCSSFEHIKQFALEVEKKRESLPFEIDGIVIKVNQLHLQKKLGATGKNVRWAVAYKFAAQREKTRIHEITVQVGRTGVLTPVAELEPIFVAGSTISRATLHNEEEVKRKDIRIGDWVIIEKGGDVIPKVVQVDFSKRPPNSLPWKMPDYCPICHTPVERSQTEVAIRCPNRSECPAQNLKRVIFFAGKQGMDIEHLGEKVVTQLVEKGFINRISDLYRLKAEDLFQLANFKEKSVNNLLTSLEKSKKVPLSRFIMALGIKHVGIETAELLATYVGNLENLAALSEDQLLEMHGIGPKVAEAIISYFANPENQEEIAALLRLGVTPFIQKIKERHLFTGKSFVLTGTLEHYTRDRARELIQERGGKVSTTLSKTTDFLLVGKEPGSKLSKAQTLAIPLLTEDEFTKNL